MLAVKSSYAAENQKVSQPWREPSIQTSYRPNRAGVFDKVSMIGCIALVVAVFWVLAANSAKVAVMNHSIATLQSQVSQVSARNAALSIQVDQLKRPSRILNIAQNQLHMKYAAPVNIKTTNSASSSSGSN